jgi:Fe-S oxidoreductase
MAKVLLINSNRFKHPWPVIPFGLCYVATVLEFNENHKVFFLDLCFSSDCEADIQKTIQSFNPDVIGVSIRNIDDTGGYNVHFLLEDVKNDVIDYCKKEFIGPVIIGGPSVGISGKEMLDYFDLEYAVRGDGEKVMSEFVYCIENHLPLEGLKGLIIRRKGMIIQDNEPNRVTDLDSLPFPKLNRYLNLDLYRRYGSPILVQTKRGCTFDCAYCTYNQIEGKQYRLRDPQQVADEIEVLVKESGINHIEFADSIFNVPLSHAKQVLRSVIGKRLNLKLHTMGLTPAAVDEELLDLMKLAGFNEVDIGVESTSDIVLKSLSKDFKLRDIIKTANLLREKRMPATWFIILGSPVETSETVFETLNSLRKITSKWDLVFVSTGVRVYNGSPYANEMFRKDNQCSSDNFFRPVKIEPEKISLEEIRAITKSFSFRYPNYYFYEKEHITPGWLLITGNFLLKLFRSCQPIWRLLILLKIMEKWLGIGLIKKRIYELSKSRNKRNNRGKNGFSLISILHK